MMPATFSAAESTTSPVSSFSSRMAVVVMTSPLSALPTDRSQWFGANLASAALDQQHPACGLRVNDHGGDEQGAGSSKRPSEMIEP